MVIGADGQMLGTMSTDAAIEKAFSIGLDLVEVSPNVTPPVCKIADAGKMRYEAQKKASESRKNRTAIVTKEVRMTGNIDKGDYEVKINHAVKFLESGHRVKVSIRFKGREISKKELVIELMDRVVKSLKELGKLDGECKMEGRKVFLLFFPIS